MADPKVVLLIFVSGKVVLTGARVSLMHLLTSLRLRRIERIYTERSTTSTRSFASSASPDPGKIVVCERTELMLHNCTEKWYPLIPHVSDLSMIT